MKSPQTTVTLSILHRHWTDISTGHGGQGPEWQIVVQLWPHGNSLSHGAPHEGTGSRQDDLSSSNTRCFPQWHVLTYSGVKWQDEQSPKWQTLSHLWWPQSSNFPHGSLHSHCTERNSQSNSRSSRPQRQGTVTLMSQGAQGVVEGWHGSRHWWAPHGKGLLQVLEHFSSTPHLTKASVAPQEQTSFSEATQGGHGPGWHRRGHLCPQSRGRPHGWSQECAVAP